MPINIGGNDITDARLGGNQLSKIYVGEDQIWPDAALPQFAASSSFDGGTVSAGTTSVSIAAGMVVTNIANPVLSNNSWGSNVATDGASTLTSTTLSSTISDSYDGVCDGPYSPAQDQVFSGTSYTASGTEDGTRTTTPRTRFTNTITTSPVSHNQESHTVTITGEVPAEFEGAGDAIMDTVSVTQAGDTANAVPNQSASCGTLTPGSSCIQLGTPSTSAISRGCTTSLPGTGTYSFAISGEASPTSGDTDTYTIGSIATTFSGGADTNYSWTVTGGTINSGQGTTSISVTWTTTGAGSVAASNSFTGSGGSTFSANASLGVTVGSAANCRSLTVNNAFYPSSAPFPLWGVATPGGSASAQITRAIAPSTAACGAGGQSSQSLLFAFDFSGSQTDGTTVPSSAFGSASAAAAGCFDTNVATSALTVSRGSGAAFATNQTGTAWTDNGAC